MNWRRLIFVGFLIILILADVCNAYNNTWDKVREKKARMVKKLRKDMRKLKKQEGAVKLVGGEGGHEGKKGQIIRRFNLKQKVPSKL